jgi:DNA-binding NarL/FixJ family response regulator
LWGKKLKPFTLYVLEKQPVNLAGVLQVLSGVAECTLVGHSADLDTALQTFTTACPDVVLLSETRLGRSSRSVLAKLREQKLACFPVLWVSDLRAAEVVPAVRAGARGVLSKTLPADSLVDCLRVVAGGAVAVDKSTSPGIRSDISHKPQRVSKRERQVIEKVIQGLSNKDVAAALSISVGTIKVHLLHIFDKTGVSNRRELAQHSARILQED